MKAPLPGPDYEFKKISADLTPEQVVIICTFKSLLPHLVIVIGSQADAILTTSSIPPILYPSSEAFE